jgi:ABC-type glycerol-3-phosphate transport system permease component
VQGIHREPIVLASVRVKQQARRNHLTRQTILIILQLALAIIVLLPFFWMFSVSIKSEAEPFSIPARLWPLAPTVENYQAVLYPAFLRYMLNSVIVSLLTMLISISTGLLAAYSFSRLDFPGRRVVLIGIVLAQMFPVVTMIIPIYQVIRQIGLINTYPALVLAYLTLTLPVSIWMLRSFINNIPLELEEAAVVDGCTRLQAFWRIIVPLARPGIAATAVWIAVVTWQEFIFALAFTTSQDMRTLPVGILDFVGQFSTNYGRLMAGSVIISMPILILFFFLQRYFIAGLTAGAVKG